MHHGILDFGYPKLAGGTSKRGGGLSEEVFSTFARRYSEQIFLGPLVINLGWQF